ncbi:hypothetical protein Agabi119p4_1635 [Agaricus bisporus var. burnettii]|uniref:Uncharacterized protein n=1 Tax=Agaricus bisporus var. burnettii TaxID=192524 RepID=A0A8H7F7W2_AGABI|nr:hypothetical protein Agabi119p4_1635 [Agaricus bisporus var. burnettii]
MFYPRKPRASPQCNTRTSEVNGRRQEGEKACTAAAHFRNVLSLELMHVSISATAALTETNKDKHINF